MKSFWFILGAFLGLVCFIILSIFCYFAPIEQHRPVVDSHCEKCDSEATRFMGGFCGWVCDEWPECEAKAS